MLQRSAEGSNHALMLCRGVFSSGIHRTDYGHLAPSRERGFQFVCGVDIRYSNFAPLCAKVVAFNASRTIARTVSPRRRRSCTAASPAFPRASKTAYMSFHLRPQPSLIWASVAKCPEPCAHIIGEQFRFFHFCEMSPAWHLGPTLHIEKALGPFTRRATDVRGKECESRRRQSIRSSSKS
jgi:hypothetical protein